LRLPHHRWAALQRQLCRSCSARPSTSASSTSTSCGKAPAPPAQIPAPPCGMRGRLPWAEEGTRTHVLLQFAYTPLVRHRPHSPRAPPATCTTCTQTWPRPYQTGRVHLRFFCVRLSRCEGRPRALACAAIPHFLPHLHVPAPPPSLKRARAPMDRHLAAGVPHQHAAGETFPLAFLYCVGSCPHYNTPHTRALCEI